jgi:hypothetical protein
MKELQELIKRVEVEINKTPSGELRNLLCDANITLQKQALNLPVVSKCNEQFFALLKYAMPTNYKDLALERIVERYINESK